MGFGKKLYCAISNYNTLIMMWQKTACDSGITSVISRTLYTARANCGSIWQNDQTLCQHSCEFQIM